MNVPGEQIVSTLSAAIDVLVKMAILTMEKFAKKVR